MPRRRFSQQYVTQAARILGLLSHETRLNIILFLVQGPGTVSEICGALDLAQSNASHHLAILRTSGLVNDERDGQFVVYRVNVPVWQAIGDGFFDHLAGGLDQVALRNFLIRRLPAGARRGSATTV